MNWISLVQDGANLLDTAVIKSDGATKLELLTKSFEGDKLLGLVYVPDFTDADGEFADADVIREAAHEALARGVKIDREHNFEDLGEGVQLVESFIVQKGDKRFEGWLDRVGRKLDATGSWGVVLKINDPEILGAVKAGDIKSLSMAGVASFEPVAKSEKTMDLTEDQIKQLTSTAAADAVKAAIPSLVEEVAKALAPKESNNGDGNASAPESKEETFNPLTASAEQIQKHLTEARKKELWAKCEQEHGSGSTEAIEAYTKGLKDLEPTTEEATASPAPAPAPASTPAPSRTSSVQKSQSSSGPVQVSGTLIQVGEEAHLQAVAAGEEILKSLGYKRS